MGQCFAPQFVNLQMTVVHMGYTSILLAFKKDEDAAVTVDWVVLTAALVLMAIGVAGVIQSALESNASTISTGIVDEVAIALT